MRNRFPEGGKAIVISQWVFWYNKILCHVQIILGKKFIIGFLKIDNYVALFEGFFFLYIPQKEDTKLSVYKRSWISPTVMYWHSNCHNYSIINKIKYNPRNL